MCKFASTSAALIVALLITICPTTSVGQVEGFSTSDILSRLKAQEADLPPSQTTENGWWEKHVVEQMRPGTEPVPANLESLTFLALQHSAQIKVYSEVPLIRETAVAEATALFDSVRYLEGLWEDVDVPVGSALTVGGTGTRFKDHNANLTAGLRRRAANGIELDLSQRIGHQNTNSTFFIPNDQGSARLNLGLTIPLMRGGGREYNESLIVLAGIDTATAEQEFLRQLQAHLLEVNRAYWSLFMERSSLAQKVKLYLDTGTIYNQLVARQRIDAQQSQLASAQAALSSQRSELVRAETAVKNAETRLRALINAQQLGQGDMTEIIPTELPLTEYTSVDITTELETGIQNRPEIIAAIKEIKAGSIRLNMAKHEMLPLLNMITQVYASGLQGASGVGEAWVDQFSAGPPSYSVGLNYEIPLGNRASRARAQRRQIELRQLEEQYRAALENVRAEIEVAVRELNTSYRELSAKNRARSAAITEAETLRARWRQMIDGNGTAGLTLIALLEAQKRVTDAEFEYSNSQLVYNLAMANLQRANGTLLQAEEVDLQRGCLDNVPETILSKGGNFIAASNTGAGELQNTMPSIAANSTSSEPLNSLYNPNYKVNSLEPQTADGAAQPEDGMPAAPVISPKASVISPVSTRKKREAVFVKPASYTDKPAAKTVETADRVVDSEAIEPTYGGALDYFRKD